jgi:hypothetical protein
MLLINVDIPERYDDNENKFISPKICSLQLEHSLVSISKWESKWEKPFLNRKEKTPEEKLDYIKCMTINQSVDNDSYYYLSQEDLNKIDKYIEAQMTAYIFPNTKKGAVNNETITSELIYYWMITLNIPFKCEKWHLNKLLALINMCNIKNQPTKKMSQREIMERNHMINESRKQLLHSNG